MWFFFFKQKTAYEMRISDWSSDVCSSDLRRPACPCRQPVLHDGGLLGRDHADAREADRQFDAGRKQEMAARHHAAAQGSGDQAGQGSRLVAVIDDATCRRGVKPRGWHRGAAPDLTKSGSGQARRTCGLTRTPRNTDEVTNAEDY